MKRAVPIFILLRVTSLSLTAQSTWKLDPGHATMTFTVTHLTISEIDGVFRDFEASITTSKEDFSDAVFELSAELNTLTTNNERRDAHLQREDMFHVEKYPKLTFKSTSITKTSDKKFELKGDLSIKGVSKSVSLELTLLGAIEHPRSKKKMAGFKATGTINRTDFGVGNLPAMVASEEIELRASGEFVLQEGDEKK